MGSRNCTAGWMGTRSSPENSVPGVHDLFPIALPLMWHIPKRVLFLCSNSQERKSDWPNYLWPRGQSGSIVSTGLAFVVVDISNTGGLVDSRMNVSCCHKTSVAETGFDFRFDSKSSAFLLRKGCLIEKHMNLASTFFSGSPHHHQPPCLAFLRRVLLFPLMHMVPLSFWYVYGCILVPLCPLGFCHVAWLLILLIHVRSLAHLTLVWLVLQLIFY